MIILTKITAIRIDSPASSFHSDSHLTSSGSMEHQGSILSLSADLVKYENHDFDFKVRNLLTNFTKSIRIDFIFSTVTRHHLEQPLHQNPFIRLKR